MAGIERGLGMLIGRWFQAMPSRRRSQLVACRPTIDLDGTDVEVYRSKKERVAWNHEGRRVGRPHPATWAEAGVVLAGDLGSGADDPRPVAAGLIARAVTNLPAGLGRPRVRADAGYFDAKVAAGALAAGADYAIAAKRNRAAWRALAALDEGAWEDCVGMRGAQAAVCGYMPAGWPEGTRTVVRRVRLEPDQVRADPRSRRRRTIRADQLALALAGETTDIYAYSLIRTNLDGTAEAIEYWFRERAWIEERHRDSKLGYALVHLPSGSWRVNQAWMWSAYLATNLSAFTQLSAESTTTASEHTPNGHAGNCSASPPVSSPTPGASSFASPPAAPTRRSPPRGKTCGRCPPPPPAEPPGRTRPPPPAAPGYNRPAVLPPDPARPSPDRTPSNTHRQLPQDSQRRLQRTTCGSGSECLACEGGRDLGGAGGPAARGRRRPRRQRLGQHPDR